MPPLPRSSPEGATTEWTVIAPADEAFIDPVRMKGWVGLVGWPTADPYKWLPISCRSGVCVFDRWRSAAEARQHHTTLQRHVWMSRRQRRRTVRQQAHACQRRVSVYHLYVLQSTVVFIWIVFCFSVLPDMYSRGNERGRSIMPWAPFCVQHWGGRWMGSGVLPPENFGNLICQTVHFGNICAIIGPQNAPILLCWILMLRRFWINFLLNS